MKKGFTLIEILVTMGLIAVVAAGVVTLIDTGPQQASRDARRRADLQRIATALELYRNDRGRYPTLNCFNNCGSCGGGNVCITTTYIQALPADPQNNTAYSYTGNNCNASGCTGFALCTNLEKVAGNSCNEYVVNNP